MNCLNCDNDQFSLQQNATIEQEFKGELLKVKAPAIACTKCGWVTVALDQLDELRRRTTDAYREQHGLLTSDQIRHYRKLLGKSQREFAQFLGVGEASVKRWETWLVQDKSSDELMRSKCEQALSKRLQQQTTITIWVSHQYVKSAVVSAQGESTQTLPCKPDTSAKWVHPAGSSVRRDASRTEFLLCAANEELALAA